MVQGVVQLALASVANACWDLRAKSRGVPLWKLLLDLSPEQVLATLDLSYLEDELAREQALAILREPRGTPAQRESVLKAGRLLFSNTFRTFKSTLCIRCVSKQEFIERRRSRARVAI